jgi:general secretion pathway protein I
MKRRDAGFTLIEALVALAILGVALAAVLRAYGAGFRSAERSEMQTQALLRAESRLAEAAATLTEPGERRGDAGGYAWRVAATPFPVEGVEKPLLRIEVRVAAPDGAEARLVTLRLPP